MIHFIRPLWLWAFIPVSLYLIWVIYASRQFNPWRSICDSHLLPALLQQAASTGQRLLYTALFLFFVITVFALAGPSWKKIKLPVYRDVSSLMLVLDLSPSMQTADLNPDRLTRAKFKIRDLISASKNMQMGLVVFSGEAFVASPLSQDAKTLTAILDELHPRMMPIAGSDMGQGLTQGLSLLAQSAVRHSNLLLITDSEPTANSWNAAKAVREAGHQVDILAMLKDGSEAQNTIDALRQLAKLGGGSLHLFTTDSSDIQQVLNDTTVMQTVKDQNIENTNLWQDTGPWFCLLLIPLVLLVLREKA